MTFQEYTQSKSFRTGVLVAGVLLVALVSFASGVTVGFHKARFSYAWGENYERNFIGGPMGGPGRGMMGSLDGRGFRNPHGTIGTIMTLSDDLLTVKDRENQESSVRISERTIIMKQRVKLTRGDLVSGDRVVVIGKPAEDGVVVADFIRVFAPDEDSLLPPFGPRW